MENMEKRIELEKRGRQADEIADLNLDNCRSTQISGLTDDFKALESLSLINVGLTTLKGFPDLPNLKKLELSDNRISNGLQFLHGCQKLTYLNLSGNKIKDLDTLEPLKKLPNLSTLDLFNCEVTNLDSYREKVFETLDGLQFLDGYDRNDQEQEDEDDDDDDDEIVLPGENGNGECSDESGDEDIDGEDDEDDDEDEDGEEDDTEVGLSYLQKSGLEDDSEGDDFDPGDDDDDEEEEDEEDEEIVDAAGEDAESRGVKRKHSDDENDAAD